MTSQRRTDEILAAMLELSQQQAARIDAMHQQMEMQGIAHAQQMAEMQAQTQQITQIHQQQVAFQQAQHEHQQALHEERQARELARGPRGPASIKRFCDLHPPLFIGIESVLEADEWLRRMEDTLRAASS